MLIFDAHLDLALNGVDFNRDLRWEVERIRAEERALGMTQPGRGTNTVSLPELRAAGVAVCLATLLARQEPRIDHDFGWSTPQACYAMAQAHLGYYRALEEEGWLRVIETAGQLRRHFQDYAADPQGVPLGVILTMEGADPLLRPESIRSFHTAGLRALGLTHYGDNRYGGGTNSQKGLAPEATALLKECQDLGITIDLTHLSDRAFWEVIECFEGRVHASHQNSRAICDWQRQFSDDQIRVVIQRHGVLGLALDVIMLEEGYRRGSVPTATLERAADQIDHLRSLAGGSVNHIGIGSDLDGAFGNEQTPTDLERYRDVHRLKEILVGRGYDDDCLAAIFHGNWLRFFGEVLPG